MSIIVLFICYHIVSVVVFFYRGVPNAPFWWSNVQYTFGKNLRIYVSKKEDVYPRLALGDASLESGRLDYNVYAYEGKDGFFFTYRDDVFYCYGSTGFFVIYAEPFQIKLIRNKNLSVERRKVIEKALSQYNQDELKLLTSVDELTKEEKEAYERLQEKAQKRIEELKNANEYP